MSYPLSFSLNIGVTGLTLKAALTFGGTIDAAYHDIVATFHETGQGNYEFDATLDDGAVGQLVFYTGTLGVATDFSGVVIYATTSINPVESETAAEVWTYASRTLTATQNFNNAGTWTGNIVGNVSTVGSVTAVGSAAITRASFAADTGLQSLRSNTAQSGSATTITLDPGASAINDFYKNCLIVLTSGTGVGQARFITAYNGATKVATVGTWKTNPAAATGFSIWGFDAIAGASAPTAAQVATAVWTDLVASSDFQVPNSIGEFVLGLDSGIPGAFTITITVVDTLSNPIQNVAYTIYDGPDLVRAGTTDVNGNDTFTTAAGTFDVALEKPNYTFGGASRTVTGNQSGTMVNDLVMTAITPIIPPVDPTLQTVYGRLNGLNGPAENAEVKFDLVPADSARPLTVGGNTFFFAQAIATTDNTGTFSIDLPQTILFDDPCFYHIVCEGARIDLEGVVLGAAPLDISTL